MSILGRNVVAGAAAEAFEGEFRAQNPRQNVDLEPPFREATGQEIDTALEQAGAAAAHLRRLGGEQIAALLGAIAEEITALGDVLIAKADEETALGIDRLKGERDRTVNQLRLFAGIAREGSWVDARIDTALPGRKPLPRPDLRRMLEPIGPVVVFGASNFPLAFSVAGGDTVSALAARNPVIVKAHPAHPGTSELAAEAIANAVRKQSLPPGCFSLLHGFRPEISLGLVKHPAARAVAFTGSLRAGRALFDAAAQRPEPIPVFSEMGSVNPLFALPGAISKGPQALAEGISRSVLLGVGQFCTCPGLVFAAGDASFDGFAEKLAEAFERSSPGTMLNAAIARGFREGFEGASKIGGVSVRPSAQEPKAGSLEGRPGLLMTDARTWLGQKKLREEIFGPATVLVRCSSAAEMLACARELEGTLTATVHATAAELAGSADLLDVLSTKAGRLVFNGFPTGVEVSPAMQHGGPYPASTDSRFTSVGTAAIYRFARPVCYQNFPEHMLAPELQDANPLGIWRTVDGQLTREPIVP